MNRFDGNPGTDARGQRDGNDLVHLTLPKGGEFYIFSYHDNPNDKEVLRRAVLSLVSNPELNFTYFDAAVVLDELNNPKDGSGPNPSK